MGNQTASVVPRSLTNTQPHRKTLDVLADSRRRKEEAKESWYVEQIHDKRLEDHQLCSSWGLQAHSLYKSYQDKVGLRSSMVLPQQDKRL